MGKYNLGVINDDTTFETDLLIDANLASLEATFANLVPDPYAQEGLRSRRYSRYRLGENGVPEHLSHEAFMQSSAINKAVGDVKRRFEEIEDGTSADSGFRRIFAAFQAHTGLGPGSVVEAHQIRWNCDKRVMIPAPEGTHQDGFDYIAMFMVDAANLTGGEVLVYRALDEAPMAKASLKTGEYVVLNDRKLFHDAAPLVPEPNAESGHWDLIVLTANR